VDHALLRERSPGDPRLLEESLPRIEARGLGPVMGIGTDRGFASRAKLPAAGAKRPLRRDMPAGSRRTHAAQPARRTLHHLRAPPCADRGPGGHPQKQLPARGQPRARGYESGGPPRWTGRCSRTTCESSPGLRKPKQSPTPPQTRPKPGRPHKRLQRPPQSARKDPGSEKPRTESGFAWIKTVKPRVPTHSTAKIRSQLPRKTADNLARSSPHFKTRGWRTRSR